MPAVAMQEHERPLGMIGGNIDGRKADQRLRGDTHLAAVKG
jgi:hypothetical protein